MSILRTRTIAILVLSFLLCTASSVVPFHIPEVAGEQVSIYDIQFTEDPSGDSPYAGQEVTVTGIVTATFYYGYFVAEKPGPWHAIFVYSKKNGPRIGDKVQVTGLVKEYYGLTEMYDISDYQLLSSGNAVDLVTVTVDAQNVPHEEYESVLVIVNDVDVTSLEDFGEWVIHDGTGSVRCDDINDYMYFPQVGDQLDSVTGVVYYSFDNFKIEPRKTNDISGDVIPHYALKGHIITMNDQRKIYFNAYVEILGDEILDIHPYAPSGVPIIETRGLIFPGLIDAHNHPGFNVLGLIPFEMLFTERYEWQSDPLYEDFKDQYYDILDYGGEYVQRTNIFKLAEVRALSAGTTTIQGFNCNGHEYDAFAHEGIVINNAERFPSRIYSKTFPLSHGEIFWQDKQDEYWDRFVIHLSEGINQASLDEFYTWKSMGMLDSRTTIIHGIPYGPLEWSAMADANANLIWSPVSNMRLYGTTTDIPEALAAGVNVALAPDWTESGAPNILYEMKRANSINLRKWHGAITPRQFAEFVTRNAAYALGIHDRVGQIGPGYRADIMIIRGSPRRPYRALLRAWPRDVKLTIVSGRPMYGDPHLMERFAFLSSLEDISIGWKQKQLAIQIEAHGVPESDRSFYEIYEELLEAYEASEPKVCEFIGLDPWHYVDGFESRRGLR